MKAKNDNPKGNDAQRQFGEEQSHGTEVSVPSAEGLSGDKTEPTFVGNCGEAEDVTPRKDGPGDENIPVLNPALVSHFESLGLPPDMAARAAMYRVEQAKNWVRRLEKEYHFEKLNGLHEPDYQLLFHQGRNILVLAVDAARAATWGAKLGLGVEFTAAEIIGTLDAREVIEVPGPEIPANAEGAIEGTYIPLESLCAILGSTLPDDTSDFCTLLDEFARNQERVQEDRLRKKRLRRSRLEDAWVKGERLRSMKVREDRSRRAKLRYAMSKQGRKQDEKKRKDKPKP